MCLLACVVYNIIGILSEYLLFVAVQISKPVETTSEFQIQNEDFPALPGSKPPTTKANGMEGYMQCM